MERIFQKAQVIGAETSTKVNDLFRQKVQLEDQLKDVESQIHYARGVLDTIGQLQDFIRQTIKQDSQREKFEHEVSLHGGDGSKDKTAAPIVEVQK